MLKQIKSLLLNIRFWVIFILSFITFYLALGIYINSCFSKITGTKVKADLSIIGFLKGNLEINKIKIYSDIKYAYGVNAITIYDFKINPDLLSIFSSKKIIYSITADKIELLSYYTDNSNNIVQITRNSNYYFAVHPAKKLNDYLIKKIEFKNISLITYYYSKEAVYSKLPDVRYKDLPTTGDLTTAVSYILSYSLVSEMEKAESKNISWWKKTLHGVDTGLDVTNGILKALNRRWIMNKKDVEKTLKKIGSDIVIRCERKRVKVLAWKVTVNDDIFRFTVKTEYGTRFTRMNDVAVFELLPESIMVQNFFIDELIKKLVKLKEKSEKNLKS